MFNKQDKIQFIIAAVFTALSLVLCFTVLPEEMQLMQGGNVKSCFYLALLTALPILVTLLVASAGKSRILSWILLSFIEIYAATIVLDVLAGFSFRTEILFHGTFLVLETLLAIHLWNIKDSSAKLAFRFEWIRSEQGFMKAQKESARAVTVLAVIEGINMLCSHFGLYSFNLSAGLTVALCYVAFIVILKRVKPLD